MHIDSYSARTDDVTTRVTGYITLFCKRRGLSTLALKQTGLRSPKRLMG